MAASSKIPLYLFQVLEEEYVALHGEELNDLDWQFAATHIQNAAALTIRYQQVRHSLVEHFLRRGGHGGPPLQ